MSHTIILDDETNGILLALASEEGITPEELIAKLVKKTDSDRHVTWSRKQQKHVRVRCSLRGCKETNELPQSDRAD